jgi:hypothetical protein
VITCGVWQERSKLLAVVLDDAGRASKPIRMGTSIPAAEGLVAHLDDTEIVIPERLLALPIARSAAASGRLWVAPNSLIEPIRLAASLSARGSAAMLARLPRIAAVRPLLHRRATDPRQLTLL